MASQTIAQIYMALRELFKEKDRLKGVDDWDQFIGILVKLEEVASEVQQLEQQAEEKEETEEETTEGE